MKCLEEKKMKGECFAGVLKEATEQEQKEMMIFLAGMRTSKLLASEQVS